MGGMKKTTEKAVLKAEASFWSKLKKKAETAPAKACRK